MAVKQQYKGNANKINVRSVNTKGKKTLSMKVPKNTKIKVKKV